MWEGQEEKEGSFWEWKRKKKEAHEKEEVNTEKEDEYEEAKREATAAKKDAMAAKTKKAAMAAKLKTWKEGSIPRQQPPAATSACGRISIQFRLNPDFSFKRRHQHVATTATSDMYMHTCIHAYTHAYIRAHRHAHMHTHTHISW